MKNRTQHRGVFGLHQQGAGAALALAIMLVPAVLVTGSAQAQTYTESVLYPFTGPDGEQPGAGLLQDAQGNLYGTTEIGGAGGGTVFKVDTTGKETVLHSFTGTDGGFPSACLMQDAQGNLFGTTQSGGASGKGTVFTVDTTGKETVLYSFAGGADGARPWAGLVQDAQGNLYGTTEWGGASNWGTVFKVDATGKETVLYSFGGGADAGNPITGLVRDAKGNIYGTTCCGGPGASGTVFELDTTGKETVLHRFTGGTDGGGPYAGLVRDAKGNLYGTTVYGGASNWGTVFKLDTTGKETVLYSFAGGEDGVNPEAGLVRDAQGNLYGTTTSAGDLACNAPYGCGTVFKLDTTGKETVLYRFTGGGDGAYPSAGLVRDAQGNLYGTTVSGGDIACNAPYGCGTVFKLTPLPSTTTMLSSSPNPSTYGQAVTFTAIVTSKLGAPQDGETVSFMKGKTVLGTGTLSGGSASFTTSTLKVGTTTVTAVYGGDSNLSGSTSKFVKQVVNKATTTTALASSQNPSAVGASVTFTASVTPEFSGKVTGTVTFYDGTTALKTIGVSGGAAKFTTKTLTSGTHTITATYNGSTSFIGSSSDPLVQTVN